VIVRYRSHGEAQPLGLRLDLDKKVFLDHADDPKTDKELQKKVTSVWEIVVRERGRRSGMQ
jgi:hypothetical protein